MMNEWIISSTILIAAVLLGRRLLRGRISLRLQYALWAVVLLRLLLPVQLYTSDLGAGAIARSVDIAEPVRQVYVSANEDRYEREYDAAYRQAVADYEALQHRFGQSYDPIVLEETARDQAVRSLELDLTRLLYGLWFAGMAVLTVVIVFCNVHLGLQLKRRRRPVEIPDSLLPVYVSEAAPTPCIFGFFRPVIYLTPDAAGEAGVRAHVLAHELTHYRHLDHIWSVLRSLCLVLHWYNPLVWIAARVSRADAELACDEGALARLGEEHRADYGRTLIGLTCPDRGASMFVTATTMTGSSGSIRERIKLLMARPRNTVLALIAVVLVGTIVVGCTFAGAPETTQPGIDLDDVADALENSDVVIFDFPDTTEPTGHTPDNDMAYTDQDLPIPDDLTASDLRNAEGLLVFPGTEWGMTEVELIAALDIQEYGIFSGMRGISLSNTTFCGYPARIAFYFDQYRNTDEWGLSDVLVGFEDEETANAVYNILYEQLGKSDAQTSGVASCVWWSDSTLADLISPEAYAVYQDEHTYYIYDGQREDLVAASSVTWFGDSIQGQKNRVCFSSRLHLARQIEAAIAPSDQTEEVRALFAEGGDPWYPAALTGLYADQYSFDAAKFFSAGQSAVTLTDAEKKLVTDRYGKDAPAHTVFRMGVQQMEQVLQTYIGTDTSFLDMSAFLFCPETDSYLLVREEVPQLRRPEILSCELLAKDQVRMFYRFPGGEERYCATILKGETWKVYSNHLLISAPQDARPLTQEETDRVVQAFFPDIYNEGADAYYGNPLACFTHSMYDDISQMSKYHFLSYFVSAAAGTEEEFKLLKAKYPDYFADWTWDAMPLPIHRHDADALDEYMMKYAGIPFRDLPDVPWVHYLEETDCYYNYTSDFGLLGFPCIGGWVYDGGAVLCARSSALFLTERDGQYYIQAHIPAIAAEG